jgi:hypothetical protein
VEISNRTATFSAPVRFEISTLHFEMQDSSDFRFLVFRKCPPFLFDY